MIIRRGLRGLGQVIPSPANFGDIQSFLDAAAAANGVSACRSGTYTGCPNIPLFDEVIQAAEQAWFNYHPAPGSPGSVTSPITGMTTVAPIVTSSSAASSAPAAAAPIPPTPTQPVQVPISSIGQSESAGQVSAGGNVIAAPTFAFSSIPWWAWALGAGALYFAFGGKR